MNKQAMKIKKMKDKSIAIKRAIGSGTEVSTPNLPGENKKILDTLIEFMDGRINADFPELKSKIGTNVRGYLNAEEIKTFQWLLITVIHSSAYRKTLMHFGNITKEEHRELKTALTHLAKYCGLIFDRIDESQIDNIIKKIDGAGVRVFDYPTLKKLLVATQDAMDYIVVERDQFELFSELIMHQHCRNCGINHSICHIYTTLSESYIPESGYNKPNCPYSYNEGNSEEGIDKAIATLVDIRKQKVSLLEDKKMSAVHDMIADEISALDKAIELAVSSKGNIHMGIDRMYFDAMIEKRDYDDVTKSKLKQAVERYVTETKKG